MTLVELESLCADESMPRFTAKQRSNSHFAGCDTV